MPFKVNQMITQTASKISIFALTITMLALATACSSQPATSCRALKVSVIELPENQTESVLMMNDLNCFASPAQAFDWVRAINGIGTTSAGRKDVPV